MCTFEQSSGVDGYRLIRIIGSGGFGDVWLCFSETLQQHYALKVIRREKDRHGRLELSAVQQFKQLGLGNSARGIMPIEHAGKADGHLYYIMPLADGSGEGSPAEPSWQPLTLGTLIRQRNESQAWFSSNEIVSLFEVLIAAVDAINAAGLVHRDIKPDNILFLQGRPVLSDISLLKPDSGLLTELGTPGYQAPSWYIESGGKPDMYGLAATLYTMLTGNAPDKIGRAAFRWPPGGEASLSPSERSAWLRLHRIIFRATAEKASDRYLTFAAMAKAMSNDQEVPIDDGSSVKVNPFRPGRRFWLVAACLLAAVCGWLALPPSDATLASGEIVSGKNPWQKCDAILDDFESKLPNYEKKWSGIKQTADQILTTFKESPASLETIDTSVNNLIPLVSQTKQLRQELKDMQNSIWGSAKMPGAYYSARVVDYSESGQRQAHLREARNVELLRAWDALDQDILRFTMMSWFDTLLTAYHSIYYAEVQAAQQRTAAQAEASHQKAQTIFNSGAPDARQKGLEYLDAEEKAAEAEYKQVVEKLNSTQKNLDDLKNFKF